MKYLLGILVCATILPAANAAPDRVVITGELPPKWLVHTEVTGQGENQITYYYTNVVLVGSHCPAVIRRYKGRLQIIGAGHNQSRLYDAGEGPNHGGISVGTALKGVDPSFQ